ncbi:hypothetical protein [Polyangium mundeleinium]|uniref:Lipoprotein n=1 Tax=Polyangium mundeleinium TaxID=2995306 RepID=A0ABT5EKI2_9BACT|nr:hypothetical protein [Polyangium mundeleinium]MDC0741265.1 hypothetical protein [Polyangium mundeleinium]
MQRVVVGWVVAWSLVVGVGCEKECKNPALTWDEVKGRGRIEGPAMPCNIVKVCDPGQGRPIRREALTPLVDPKIIDRGYANDNRDSCIHKAQRLELIDSGCKGEASPERICLDAPGSSNGPDFTGSTGGTFVTVGVGAGSGDYWFHEQGAGGPESCKTDLWFVFDWCESPARWPRKYIFEGHVAAFQAGCVMHLCPEQITCTEIDPMWCGTPCEDPTGATFWRNLAVLGDRCGHLSGDIDGDGEWEPSEDRAYRGCADAEMKALCPACFERWKREGVTAQEVTQEGTSPRTSSTTQ